MSRRLHRIHHDSIVPSYSHRLLPTPSSETAAQENGTSFFPLLDRVSEGAFSGAKTDKELYEQFLQVLQQDGHITHPEALSTFKLALSLRSAAPRIEAHYQYYNTAVEPSLPTNQDGCETWFLSGDKQYCDPAMATERGAVGVTLYVVTFPPSFQVMGRDI